MGALLRFAYADPPYMGMSVKNYGELHPEAAVYDGIDGHRGLIERLKTDFPDGWALSMSSTNLYDLLPLCPREARVCAWCQSWASFKPGARLQRAWEPVILMGGRNRKERHCVRDWFAAPIVTRKGFPGEKPEAVINWILTMLAADPEDEIIDLFPGSGAVGATIDKWRANPRLFA
jgi:hypothetical protein